jgi:hypothetical protein
MQFDYIYPVVDFFILAPCKNAFRVSMDYKEFDTTTTLGIKF